MAVEPLEVAAPLAEKLSENKCQGRHNRQHRNDQDDREKHEVSTGDSRIGRTPRPPGGGCGCVGAGRRSSGASRSRWPTWAGSRSAAMLCSCFRSPSRESRATAAPPPRRRRQRRPAADGVIGPSWPDAASRTSPTPSRRASTRTRPVAPLRPLTGIPDPPELPPGSDSRLAHYLLEGRGWIPLRVTVDLLAGVLAVVAAVSGAAAAGVESDVPASLFAMPLLLVLALAVRGMYRTPPAGRDPRRRRAGGRRGVDLGHDRRDRDAAVRRRERHRPGRRPRLGVRDAVRRRRPDRARRHPAASRAAGARSASRR